MGESVVENLDPRLGSTIWADWTNQASNRPLIVSQIRQLVPVQEMLPFQRVIRTRGFDQPFSVNEKVTFRAEIPQDEAWRILAITILHSNTAAVQWVVEVLAQNQINFIHEVVHIVADPNQRTPLYPSSPGPTSDSRSQTRTGPPLELFPGDKLDIRSLTPSAAGGGQADLSVRYELIPLPLAEEIDTFFTGSASV